MADWIIPQSLVDQYKKTESSGDPWIKAPTSSGSGLFQFLKATWLGLGGSWGSDPTKAFGDLRPSPQEQTDMFGRLIQGNADVLAGAGNPVTPGTLYMAHFLGAGTANQVLAADPSAPIAPIVGKAVVDANGFLKGWSVNRFIQWATKAGGGSTPLQTTGGNVTSITGGVVNNGDGTFLACPKCSAKLGLHELD